MNPSWNFRFIAPTSDILMRLVVSVYMWDSHDWWYILPGSRIPNQAFYIPEHQAFGMKHLIASRHPHQASSLLHQASLQEASSMCESSMVHSEACSIVHQTCYMQKHGAFCIKRSSSRSIQHLDQASHIQKLHVEAFSILNQVFYYEKHPGLCMKHPIFRSIQHSAWSILHAEASSILGI